MSALYGCKVLLGVSGGIALDLTAITGIVEVDAVSRVVDVRAGMFGDVFEEILRRDGRVLSVAGPFDLPFEPMTVDADAWGALYPISRDPTSYQRVD